MKMHVQIAPGRVCAVDLGTNEMPTHVIAKLVPVDGTGLMRAVPVEWSPCITLSSKELRKVGIDLPTYIVRKLIKAGFVKGYAPTPRITRVDVLSLRQHLLATRCDGGSTDFWTRERTDAYLEAFGSLRED
ncbi:MAG: hypothetical protein V4662_13810 [Verrucomicrobiota bacterium]